MKSIFQHPRNWASLGAALSVALIGASNAWAAPKIDSFDTKSILVLSSASNTSKLQTRGLRVTHQFKAVGWSQVALSHGADVTQTIADLKAQGIEAAPNYLRHFFKTPNDPQFGTQWDMAKIGAPAAWNVTTGGTESVGGSDVVVAIVDSGITVNHPDLKANIYVNKKEIPNNGKDDDGDGFVDDVNGYDFGQDNGAPDDVVEHGTHVAGTIGAVGNNKVGVSGINWKVKLMSCRIGADDGSLPSTAIIGALDYLVKMKKAGVNIRVANHSYGGYGFSQAEYDAFKRASDAGIINVCAAGNDNINNDVLPAYPASFGLPGMVSVAASDQNDLAADFSNIGVKSVNIAAPGVDILSTLPPGTMQDGSLYGTLSGTSMAAPHVTGALALLLSQNPTMSMQAAVSRLYAMVDKLPRWKPRVSSGGRLNLAKLLSGTIYGVSGHVTRADGTPVVAATVTLGSSKTTTDSAGFYRFSGLGAGKYTLSATLKGFTFKAAANSSLAVTLGGSTYTQTEDLIATPVSATYSVFGTTYDSTGKPKAGVQIFLSNSAQPAAISDSKGQYTLDDLAAGKYTLSAQFQGTAATVSASTSTSKAVTLPTTRDVNSPNAQVDWTIPLIDNTRPVVKLTSPLDGQNYQQGQLNVVAGNIYDNDQLSTVYLQMYKYIFNDDDTVTFVQYNWTTDKFSDDPSDNEYKAFKTTKQSLSFSEQISPLEVGTYYVYAYAYDRSGNSNIFGAKFTVTTTGNPNPSPQQATYPRIKFAYPYANAIVKASQAFTANGTAHADNGVQNLNFYLEQVDQRGVTTGYYDWVMKAWVSSQGSSTTYSINYNGSNDVKWTLPVPALPYGRYVLHAYGTAVDGSQPPGDGSLDDNVAFTAGNYPTSTTPPSGSGS